MNEKTVLAPMLLLVLMVGIVGVIGLSKAKSEADVLLSLMGVEEKHFDEVIDLKLNIALQALIKAQRKNVFPIIAYSYYEYRRRRLRGACRVLIFLVDERINCIIITRIINPPMAKPVMNA